MKLYGHPEKIIEKNVYHSHTRADFYFKFMSPYGRIITLRGTIKDKHHPQSKTKEVYHAVKHVIEHKHGKDLKKHVLKEAIVKKLHHHSYLKSFHFYNNKN